MNVTTEPESCVIDTAGEDRFIQGKGIKPAQAAALKELIRRFNRDVTTSTPGLREQTERSKRNLVGEAEGRLPPTAQALLERYAVADVLAAYFKRRTQLAAKLLFILGCLAVIALECYHLAHGGPGETWKMAARWALSGFVVLWLIVLALWGLTLWHRWQDKHQDYRALAEGLRVQFFWHFAGLPDLVGDYYLRRHRGELAWIQYAVQTWHSQKGGAHGAGDAEMDVAEKKQLLLDKWMREQHDWFAGKAKEYESWKKGLAVSAYALFLTSLGLGSVLVVLLWQLLGLGGDAEAHHAVTGWAGLVVGITLVMAGTFLGYKERRAIAEQANMYAVMSEIYEDTLERYRANQGELYDLLRELGKEALSENADWLLMHRERPLEPKI